MQYYILINGQQMGPYETHMLLSRGLTSDTLVWCEGMSEWLPAMTVPELQALFLAPVQAQPYQQPYQQQPYQQPYQQQPYQQPYQQQPYQQQPYQQPYQHHGKSDKDKTVAGILALLFGSIGIQYFYLGKVGGGILTILLTAITCGFWSILMFIQGIVILTMSDEDFQRKFVYTDKTLPLF